MKRWKDIDGYEGLYQVSTSGEIKNARSGRVLKYGHSLKGYNQVSLSKNGIVRRFMVTTLVAKAFLQPKQHNQVIVRKDGDKTNDSARNLSWGSRVNGKPILQFTEDGKLVREFKSQSEVQEQCGYFQSNISSCCRGKIETAYGFVWRFKQ